MGAVYCCDKKFMYLNLPEDASRVPVIILSQWDVLYGWTVRQKLLHMLEKPRLMVAANFIQL